MCIATSSAATNWENFCLSCASKYHISSLLSCESRLPDDRLHSSVSGCCKWQQHFVYLQLKRATLHCHCLQFHVKEPLIQQ